MYGVLHIYYYVLSCSMDFLNHAQRLQFLQHLVDIKKDIVEFDDAIAQFVRPEEDKEFAIEGELSGSMFDF